MKLLSRDAAAAIFAKYAFYLLGGDVIPEDKAVMELSGTAVDFAKRQDVSGRAHGAIGLEDGDEGDLFRYLTYKGFMEAVSFRNAELVFAGSGENITAREIILLPGQ
jgi:hypothetical protein